MARQAVFIHSLWRSGSTWLFDRFRRSAQEYFCYQEPFHEALLQLDTDPSALLQFADETSRSLRHPQLSHPYFLEFYALREALRGKFRACISYYAFFDPSACTGFDEYVQALIHAAPATPVLQCCRSFGRVRHLRENHGGTHIHLWRDAVSQWFSYQISDYFDIVSLMVLGARNPPPAILAIRQRIGLPEPEAKPFAAHYATLRVFPMRMEQRYLVFYGLWLYSLLENSAQCDLDINLDQLSEDPAYREVVGNALQKAGIVAVDISSAQSPVSFLDAKEKRSFAEIEQQLEQLFVEHGYSAQQIEDVLQVRDRHRPKRRATVAMLRRNLRQAREMAYRYGDRLSEPRNDDLGG